MEATYRVDGMSCGGCAANLTKALDQISPDVDVTVSQERGTAAVRGHHDPGAVRRAVEQAGFTFVGRQRD